MVPSPYGHGGFSAPLPRWVYVRSPEAYTKHSYRLFDADDTLLGSGIGLVDDDTPPWASGFYSWYGWQTLGRTVAYTLGGKIVGSAVEAHRGTRIVASDAEGNSAIHEAGHAVMCELVGFPVIEAELVQDGHIQNGRVAAEWLPARWAEDPEGRAYARFAVDLAGMVAAELATGKPRFERSRLSKADQAAVEVYLGPGDDLPEQTVAQVFEMLRERWPAVLEIADRLRVTGKLTGDQVRAILAETTKA